MTPIKIIGGGIAGLVMGIQLRQQNIPAVIYEAGNYPRHRVCGEFISGRGPEILEESGLLEGLLAKGARWIETAAFFGPRRLWLRRKLPQRALGISRWMLDAALAEKFQMAGGTLLCGERWQGERKASGVIDASGRRRDMASKTRWFGVKGHARGITMDADLEMHFQKGRYVGLCRLANGTVNVCGLVWDAGEGQRSVPQLLAGQEGTVLHRRLIASEWNDDSFCAVAALPLHGALCGDGMSIGDALAMVPPVTGNGMSFALETACFATPRVIEFVRGQKSWEAACRDFQADMKRKVGTRVMLANVLHKMLLSRPSLCGKALQSGWIWRRAFALTR